MIAIWIATILIIEKKGKNFLETLKKKWQTKVRLLCQVQLFYTIKNTKTKGQRTDFSFRLIYYCFVRLCTSIFNQLYLSFSLSDHHLGLGHMGRGHRGLKGSNFLFYYYICRSIYKKCKRSFASFFTSTFSLKGLDLCCCFQLFFLLLCPFFSQKSHSNKKNITLPF